MITAAGRTRSPVEEAAGCSGVIAGDGDGPLLSADGIAADASGLADG